MADPPPSPPRLRSRFPPWRRRAAPVRPEAAFTVLGDIHGRDDLLARALARTSLPVVCVGDYVDRGPRSAGVLRRLFARPDVVCLMGNHEEMLLDFLDDPAGRGRRWLDHGGAQTVESFGLDPRGAPGATRDALAAAMGPDLVAWVRGLPSSWISGNVAVVHAAADPARPLDGQDPAVLRWGHRAFPGWRRDGIWVIRGHVTVGAPTVAQGVVSIDTGAWATDRLTLAHVRPGEIRFEEA